MSNYDENKPSKYILLIWILIICVGMGCRRDNQRQISIVDRRANKLNKLNLNDYTDDSETGLILEVDLEYPRKLYNLHNDFPLPPEQKKVEESMLVAKRSKISSIFELIPTLNDKEKYVLQFRNLQLCIDLRLIITKIHRVLKFKQCVWLKPYTDFNTDKRKQAKNSFEKGILHCLW